MGPGSRCHIRPALVHRRSAAAEDAVRSVEDGDCSEAAEEPPELIPGGQDRHTHTHAEPAEDHVYNYGIRSAAPSKKIK